MSAPAHTLSPTAAPIAFAERAVAGLDRVLPYVGPGIALVLGATALGHRSLDTDEAATLDAARGAFSLVVERALDEDPAKAGYLALLRPVVAWNDGEQWVRLPSVAAAVLAAIVAYRLGRRLAGRHAGAAASIVLATSLGVVSVSRTVGPLALALAAMLLSTALFARAVDHGNALWWAVYAVSAALLPLTHPIAASALAAQLVAVAVGRREIELRLAVPAVAVAVVESGLLLTASAIDRLDAADGAGPLELADIGVGAARAVSWSPLIAAPAAWGLVTLYRWSDGERGAWKVALVGGLVLAPLVAVLAAGAALPVYPREALVVAAGGIAVATGIGLAALTDRRLQLAALIAVAVGAVAAFVTVALREPTEDWREATRIARAGASPRSTVVVLPTRARAAFAYYARDVRTTLAGRGDAVTVVVAGDPARSEAAARMVVSPPRYALLEERRAGSRLVVQRWVRP